MEANANAVTINGVIVRLVNAYFVSFRPGVADDADAKTDVLLQLQLELIWLWSRELSVQVKVQKYSYIGDSGTNK